MESLTRKRGIDGEGRMDSERDRYRREIGWWLLPNNHEKDFRADITKGKKPDVGGNLKEDSDDNVQ